jgi:metal-responsive CopG/Arc/MetJ family transcriptional regulator
MTDEKQRISLFLDKGFVVKMDKENKSAGFKSRNDFVVYAVNSYFADKLLSDENSVVNEKLAKEIAKASVAFRTKREKFSHKIEKVRFL